MAYLAPPPNGSDTNSFEYQDWLYKTRQQAASGGGGSGVTSVSAGTNITITGTSANPIINSTGGGGSGTVTSVTGTGYITVTNNTTTPIVTVNVPIHKFTSDVNPPSGPINGDRWFDTSVGIEYTWITTNSVWAQI